MFRSQNSPTALVFQISVTKLAFPKLGNWRFLGLLHMEIQPVSL